jgi:transcriptional regulator with XRE-family HTH domain
MNERDISEKELALKLNITSATVDHWLKGIVIPNAAYIERVAEVLSVKVEEVTEEVFPGVYVGNENSGYFDYGVNVAGIGYIGNKPFDDSPVDAPSSSDSLNNPVRTPRDSPIQHNVFSNVYNVNNNQESGLSFLDAKMDKNITINIKINPSILTNIMIEAEKNNMGPGEFLANLIEQGVTQKNRLSEK